MGWAYPIRTTESGVTARGLQIQQPDISWDLGQQRSRNYIQSPVNSIGFCRNYLPKRGNVTAETSDAGVVNYMSS